MSPRVCQKCHSAQPEGHTRNCYWCGGECVGIDLVAPAPTEAAYCAQGELPALPAPVEPPPHPKGHLRWSVMHGWWCDCGWASMAAPPLTEGRFECPDCGAT